MATLQLQRMGRSPHLCSCSRLPLPTTYRHHTHGISSKATPQLGNNQQYRNCKYLPPHIHCIIPPRPPHGTIQHLRLWCHPASSYMAPSAYVLLQGHPMAPSSISVNGVIQHRRTWHHLPMHSTIMTPSAPAHHQCSWHNPSLPSMTPSAHPGYHTIHGNIKHRQSWHNAPRLWCHPASSYMAPSAHVQHHHDIIAVHDTICPSTIGRRWTKTEFEHYSNTGCRREK